MKILLMMLKGQFSCLNKYLESTLDNHTEFTGITEDLQKTCAILVQRLEVNGITQDISVPYLGKMAA